VIVVALFFECLDIASFIFLRDFVNASRTCKGSYAASDALENRRGVDVAALCR
jgi:hypothetical protein